VGYFHACNTANLIQVMASGRGGVRASVAYDRILLYFQAARTQQRRIARLIKNYNLFPSDPARRTALSQIFTEIHFYFIAWKTIKEMFEVLSHSSGLSCITPLLSRHKQLLNHYGDGRDTLEHYRDRLPGGARVQNMSAPWALGNLYGTDFSFGGLKWDVGPSSIEKLKIVVKELEREARREAKAKYQSRRNTRKPSAIC